MVKYIRSLILLWAALAALSISGARADAPTLNGATPAIGSATSDIKKDGDLEYGELYKRACIQNVTVGGSANAITITSPSVPVAALNNGICFKAILTSSITAAATVQIDGLAAKSLRKQDGTAAGSGDANSGILMEFDYVSADNSGAGGWRILDPVSTGGGGTPGGSSGQIQYNNAGSFGGIAVTGSGNVVEATSPTLVTPILGTPTSATLTNATGLPISTGVSGLGTGVATALGTNVGTAGSPVVNGGVLGTPSSGTLTNTTGLPISTGVSGLGSGVATGLANAATGTGAPVLGTSPTIATPVINGLPTGTGVASAATVSTLAARDANGNLTAVNHISGFSTTATAAGTTALTVTSNQIQVFTGSTTQTVTLPTTSIVAGQTYWVINQSTGAVTVQSSGANTITTLAANTSGFFTAVVATPTTAANWASQYLGPLSGLSPGTGVATALGVNVGSAGAFVTNGGALGTPSSATLTNATGLPVSTGVSGLGTGVATALGTSVGSAGAVVTNGGALGTPSSGSLANATGLPISTGVSGLGTGVATALGNATNAASGIAAKDANANLSSANFIAGFTTTATAAGTTALTVSSNRIQVFTGSTTQTVTLPTTSVVAGHQHTIINQSTGAVTVQSSGANTVTVMAGGTSATFTAVVATPTTAANWASQYFGDVVASGKALNVSNSLTLAGTDGTTMTFPSTSATIARTDAANTFTGVQTMTSPALTTPAITGLATGSGVASAATASTLVSRDSNANEFANAFVPNLASTATAGSTTTLTNASSSVQVFTGTSAQTVQLPAVSTLAVGWPYTIVNSSSNTITLNSSGGNLVQSIAAGNTYVAYANSTSGTTAASWSGYYVSSGAGTGTLTSVTVSAGNGISTSGTCNSTTTITCTVTDTRVDANGQITPIAGTTSLAPIVMPSGTLNTTAQAGGVEYDGAAFYGSTAASTRGVVPTQQVIVLNAAYTLVSQQAAQKLFNSTTNGAVTLAVGTYHMRCSFSLTSLSSTSSGFGFALGGAATFTQSWWATAIKSTLASPGNAGITFNTAANTGISASSTSTTGEALIDGIVRVTVSGTVIPQVSLGSASAAIVGINSYCEFDPFGSSSVTNVGNWN